MHYSKEAETESPKPTITPSKINSPGDLVSLFAGAS